MIDTSAHQQFGESLGAFSTATRQMSAALAILECGGRNATPAELSDIEAQIMIVGEVISTLAAPLIVLSSEIEQLLERVRALKGS